jgi:hypothetical protein
MKAVGAVCASAFLQVMNRSNYNDLARMNRERISSDARKQADFLVRLNAKYEAKGQAA